MTLLQQVAEVEALVKDASSYLDSIDNDSSARILSERLGSLDFTAIRMELESGQWKPIETAPRDGTYVLLINMNCQPEYRNQYIGAWRHGTDREPWEPSKQWRDYSGRYNTPTHWMPLPESPQ